MRSYKRYTRRKRLLKQIAVVALVFILGFVLLRAVSYMAIQGEIPMINSFNLFRREADTSFGWNLILVNDDYCVPRNYEVELTELSNGEKVDSRIYPQLQQMFDDARAEGLGLLIISFGYLIFCVHKSQCNCEINWEVKSSGTAI